MEEIGVMFDFKSCRTYKIHLDKTTEHFPQSFCRAIGDTVGDIMLSVVFIEDSLFVSSFSEESMNDNINLCLKKLGYVGEIEEIKYAYDSFVKKNAIENHLQRCLEKCGFWRIKSMIFNPKTSFSIDSFRYYSIQNKIVLNGVPKLVKPSDFRMELTKSQIKALETRKFLRTEPTKCILLPNLSNGFVHSLSSSSPKGLIEYWWNIHGILIESIDYVCFVSLTGSEDSELLIYPLQCVLSVYGFIEMKKPDILCEHFSQFKRRLLQSSTFLTNLT